MIRRAVRLALVLALLGVPAALAQRSGDVPDALRGVGIEQRLDEPVPLDLRFTDDLGRAVELGQYFEPGKPVLLTLVYYDCPMLCNIVLDGLVQTLREMDWVPGEQFELVTVSIDPNESTALARQKKQNYLRAYGRSEADAGWHFLTGEADAVRTLADAVGFHYEYLPDKGEFAHSAALFVITPEARISRYLIGIRHEPRTLRLSLVEASNGEIGTAVDQFLLYCYRYDAEEGQYTPIAMRLMRIGGAVTVLVLGAVIVGFWRRDSRKRTQ